MKPNVLTYFMQRGADGPIKIGHSQNVHQRRKELATGCAEPLRIVGVVNGNCEKQLQNRFEEHKISGEWFQPVPEVLDAAMSALPPPPPTIVPPTPIEARQPSRPDRPGGGRALPAKPKHQKSLAHDIASSVIARAMRGERTT